MSLAERLTVSWVSEQRLQVVDAVGALPAFIGWYVFVRGLAADGVGVFGSTVFGSTLLLFTVFGAPLAAIIVITSSVRYGVSGPSPRQIDVALACVYMAGIAVFVIITRMAGTARPTGAGGGGRSCGHLRYNVFHGGPVGRCSRAGLANFVVCQLLGIAYDVLELV